MDEETVAAETAEESSQSADTLKEAPKPATAEIVAEVRAAREKPATEKPAADAAADKKVADEKAGGDEKKPEFYTAAEYVNLDLRTADINKVQPELRTTFKAMQLAERSKHEKLNRAIEDAKKPPAKTEKADDDEEQIFTDDEIDKMLGSKKGQAKLDKWAAERGLDFEQVKVEAGQRLIRSAVGDATAKHAELKDEKFFDETADAIAADPEWSEAFAENKGNRKMLGLIFEAAAASVKLARATAKAAEVQKEKETVAKDKEKIKDKMVTANAKNQAALLPARKAGASGSRSTLDIVKEVRAARKSV